MIDNAIILEGQRFDWDYARKECDQLLEAGREFAAASCADPGVCSCPRCHRSYWAEGIRQRCPACLAEYETSWWSMLSWGVQHGRILADKSHPMHRYHTSESYPPVSYARSAVFQWGTAHPDCALDSRVVFSVTDWIAVWAGADYPKEGTVVGGKVIGVVRGPDNTLLNVQERGKDVCAVRCIEDHAWPVGIGDQVWWQSGTVYLTPKRRRGDGELPRDIPMQKVGYSH